MVLYPVACADMLAWMLRNITPTGLTGKAILRIYINRLTFHSVVVHVLSCMFYQYPGKGVIRSLYFP